MNDDPFKKKRKGTKGGFGKMPRAPKVKTFKPPKEKDSGFFGGNMAKQPRQKSSTPKPFSNGGEKLSGWQRKRLEKFQI